MIRFVETFFRHRLLLGAPIVLALLVSVGLVLHSPRQYESSARIFFDDPTGTISNPADAQQQSLTQLIATRSFCAKVASGGPLDTYLEQQATAPPSFLTRVLRKLHLKSRSTGWTQVQIDDQAYQLLNSKAVTVLAAGPNIVSITFDAASPALAQGTTQAIADQFTAEILSDMQAQSQAAVTFYTEQVKGQDAALAAADVAVYQYLAAHPSEAATTAIPDATLTELRRTDDGARQRDADLQGKLDQASLQLAQEQQPGAGNFRIIDPANLPYQPTSLIKPLLFSGIGGLLAGIFVMLFGLLALTFADGSVRRPEDVQSVLGLTVVGTAPREQAAR